MGIYLLNTFLQSIRNNGSKKIGLNEISGRKIVVDVFIYLYRFKAMGGLLENIFKMCTIFRYYNISPLFVFDGKVNKEIKGNTLLKRKEERVKAKLEYNNLKEEFKFATELERTEIEEKMNRLRRKFVKITRQDIDDVKHLLEFYGIQYIIAEGEADELCSAIVENGYAYACLSEDTDMFAYGCPRILKFISLINHTAILYSMKDIMNALNIKFKDFQELCLLSGTDYNSSKKNIFSYYDLYKKMNKQKKNEKSFIDWLISSRYISLQIYQEIKSIQNIYNKNSKDILNNISYLLIKNKKINYSGVESIMKKENFIFAY